MRTFMRSVARLVWFLAAVLLTVEIPFGPVRLGILPDAVFYVAAAIVCIGAWPIFTKFARARRDGRLRTADRERSTDVADPPHRTTVAQPGGVSPNER